MRAGLPTDLSSYPKFQQIYQYVPSALKVQMEIPCLRATNSSSYNITLNYEKQQTHFSTGTLK